ncbi:MAG: hypothetical protein R3300_08300 [Candidatus Promineifilaceae bacterium]|nr:hypothetical protein [Candidatus Promineifilaceae bacterium]
MSTSELTSPADARPGELEHLERAQALRRFNRLTVYLPLGLVTMAMVAVVVWLIIISLAGTSERAAATMSGAADIVVTLTGVVLMLLCAVFPLLFFGLTFQLRRRGSQPLFRLQRLFWRANGLIARLSAIVNRTAPKVADALIRVHARFTYIFAVAKQIPSLFKRS